VAYPKKNGEAGSLVASKRQNAEVRASVRGEEGREKKKNRPRDPKANRDRPPNSPEDQKQRARIMIKEGANLRQRRRHERGKNWTGLTREQGE